MRKKCQFDYMKLEKILPKSNTELYRDDGLALFRNHNRQKSDKFRKNIQVFKVLVLGLRLKLISK